MLKLLLIIFYSIIFSINVHAANLNQNNQTRPPSLPESIINNFTPNQKIISSIDGREYSFCSPENLDWTGRDINKLDNLNRVGIDLLSSLIKTTQSEPSITTAGLLERWRDDKQGQHLGKLVVTDLPKSEEFDAVAELEECLNQLAVASHKERIELLIEKQRFGGLTEEEKLELKQQK